MDNNDTLTTQLGDTTAASIDVSDHLESGEPNIVAIALAIQNHQEALKKKSKRPSSECLKSLSKLQRANIHNFKIKI